MTRKLFEYGPPVILNKLDVPHNTSLIIVTLYMTKAIANVVRQQWQLMIAYLHLNMAIYIYIPL